MSDPDLVRATARLARLSVTDDEARRLGVDFAAILDAFRGPLSIDVEGVEPLTYPTELATPLRADREEPPLDRDTLLDRAPEVEDGFYRVPKTLGDTP